jgi:predicted Ser/Thr protein kinase
LIKTINSKKSYILNPNNVLFERVIGSGSAGEVYIGRYEGNVVAIKKVKTASNPGALKEF